MSKLVFIAFVAGVVVALLFSASGNDKPKPVRELPKKASEDWGERTAARLNDSWWFWAICGILGWLLVGGRGCGI